jgi:hypothetical protein
MGHTRVPGIQYFKRASLDIQTALSKNVLPSDLFKVISRTMLEGLEYLYSHSTSSIPVRDSHVPRTIKELNST